MHKATAAYIYRINFAVALYLKRKIKPCLGIVFARVFSFQRELNEMRTEHTSIQGICSIPFIMDVFKRILWSNKLLLLPQ